MERKSVEVRDFEIKSASQGTIEAVFSTLDCIDHDGDVTVPGAIKSGSHVAMSAYGHRSWDGDMPVGRGTIHEVGNELLLRGQLFLSTTHGRDTFETIKAMGDLQEFSYGFTVKDSAHGQFEGKSVRYLKALDIHEVSPVLKGAGIGTRTLAMKGKSDLRAELRAQRDRFNGDTPEAVQRELWAAYLKFTKDDLETAIELERRAERARTHRYSADLVSTVDPETVKAARAGIRAVADEYGIDPSAIRITWYSQEPEGDGFGDEHVIMASSVKLRGFCFPRVRPDDIFLRSDLDPYNSWTVAVHELAHLTGADEPTAQLAEEFAKTAWNLKENN